MWPQEKQTGSRSVSECSDVKGIPSKSQSVSRNLVISRLQDLTGARAPELIEVRVVSSTESAEVSDT